MEEYKTKYLSPFPTDFYQKNLFLYSLKYKNYYFYHLDKNDRFEDFLAENLLETNIINSKKTAINLYQHENFKWLEKIVKLDWKRDDLHQVFVSYFYINQLRTICPNFIHTYFHKEEENQTRLFRRL